MRSQSTPLCQVLLQKQPETRRRMSESSKEVVSQSMC